MISSTQGVVDLDLYWSGSVSKQDHVAQQTDDFENVTLVQGSVVFLLHRGRLCTPVLGLTHGCFKKETRASPADVEDVEVTTELEAMS